MSVGIFGTAHWSNPAEPRAVYPDVDHRLPVLSRETGELAIDITFGRRGGVRVRTRDRDGNLVGSGVWFNGTFTPDKPSDS